VEHIPGLTQEDWDLAQSVHGFTDKYLLSRYDDPKPIPDVHEEWWALFVSQYKQVSIAAPRGHAKSTALTFAFALFIICFKVTRHCLLIGSNEELSAAFLLDIKIELAENDALRAEFGINKFKKETETELIIEFKNGDKTRVVAKGAGQRMRGLKWERKRPDWVLFDDMEDQEMVLNDLRKKKFSEWFYGTVMPMIKSGGKIRGVGTIIGFGSFLELTMPQEKSKNTVIEPLRSFSKVVQDGEWMSVKYRAHNPDFSEILWEEQWDEKKLKAERRGYAGRGMLDIYGQEYLNNPIDETTAYFRKNDFLAMRETDYESKKTFYSAADFAIAENERAAYTVIITGGMDSDGFLNIVDVRRARIDGLEIVEEMFSVQARYEPEIFRVESENIAKSIGPFLYKRMDETQTYINIDDKPPTKDKDKRARSIQARMRAGKVRFDKEAEWYPDFEEELTKYPKFPYKDQVDAIAWLGLMLEEMVEPDTEVEMEEDEYQAAFEEYHSMGACESTGY